MKHIYNTLAYSLLIAIIACNNNPSSKKNPAINQHADSLSIQKIKGKNIGSKHYKSGKLKTTGELKDSTLKNGIWKYWYDNDTLWSECNYKNGLKNGTTKVYFKSGILKYSGYYSNDIPSGHWMFYNEDGSIAKEIQYD